MGDFAAHGCEKGMTDHLRLDDIRLGDWVVISEFKSTAEPGGLAYIDAGRHCDYAWQMSGIPMQVRAVRLPFLLVHLRPNPKQKDARPLVTPIDTRHYRLLKVDRHYAKAWWREQMPKTRAEKRRDAEWQQAERELQQTGRVSAPKKKTVIWPPRAM